MKAFPCLRKLRLWHDFVTKRFLTFLMHESAENAHRNCLLLGLKFIIENSYTQNQELQVKLFIFGKF
jgi:hypothetical protein